MKIVGKCIFSEKKLKTVWSLQEEFRRVNFSFVKLFFLGDVRPANHDMEKPAQDSNAIRADTKKTIYLTCSHLITEQSTRHNNCKHGTSIIVMSLDYNITRNKNVNYIEYYRIND